MARQRDELTGGLVGEEVRVGAGLPVEELSKKLARASHVAWRPPDGLKVSPGGGLCDCARSQLPKKRHYPQWILSDPDPPHHPRNDRVIGYD